MANGWNTGGWQSAIGAGARGYFAGREQSRAQEQHQSNQRYNELLQRQLRNRIQESEQEFTNEQLTSTVELATNMDPVRSGFSLSPFRETMGAPTQEDGGGQQQQAALPAPPRQDAQPQGDAQTFALGEGPETQPLQASGPGALPVDSGATAQPQQGQPQQPTSDVDQVVNTPPERIPQTSTNQWREYRDEIRNFIREQGGDAQAQLEADKQITQYQMGRFNELGNAAVASLGTGDVENAKKLMDTAYQYMPTRNRVRFMQRDGNLVAAFTDEESGDIQRAEVMTPRRLTGYLQRFQDPKAWLSFTSDLDSQRRGDTLAALQTEIQAGNLAARSREADVAAAREGRLAAGDGGGSERPPGTITPEDIRDELINQADQTRLMNPDEAPTQAEIEGMVGTVEALYRHNPEVPVGTLAQIVFNGRNNPNLMQRLQQEGLLPAGAAPAGQAVPAPSQQQQPGGGQQSGGGQIPPAQFR